MPFDYQQYYMQTYPTNVTQKLTTGSISENPLINNLTTNTQLNENNSYALLKVVE